MSTKMRNNLQNLLILSLFFSTSYLNAQCPLPSFNSPDSACKGTSVLFSNTSAGNNQAIKWDFNSADAKQLPTGGIVGTFANEIATSTGVDFMKVNNNYIAFNLKSFASLVRLEYGNSLSNTPVFTNLGDIGGAIGSGNLDFELYEEAGNYYALINTAFGQLIVLNFGNNLLNTPTASSPTLPPGLFVTAFNMDLKKMGTDIVAVIANISGGNVTVINFGSSILNPTPAAYNITVPGANPITTALVNDCGHFYAFVGHVSASPFSIIDFGTSITQTPVQILNFTNTTNYAYKKIHVINEGGNFYLIGNTYGGELLHIFPLGTSPANINPPFINAGSIGAFGTSFWTFSIKNFDSEIGGFACNYNTGELSWFKFPQLGNATPLYDSIQNPFVTFNDTGLFYVSIDVTDTVTGFSKSILDSIYISDAPSASFTNGAACIGSGSVFTSTSSGNPVQYLWDFGDGQIGNGNITTNNYVNSGNFTVTLIVMNSAGCSDTTINSITVNDPPEANFTFTNNPCAGAEVLFFDSSTTNAGTITQWDWSFTPNDSANGNPAIYSYNANGQYPVELIIQASTGCVDTIIKNIDVIPGPIVAFEVSNTCLGDTVDFINSTFISGGMSISYLWNFTLTDSSLQSNPSFPFQNSTAGDYNVMLTATAINGCVDTVSKTIHVGPSANVHFVIDDDTVCTAAPVQFTDSSTVQSSETILKRIWDFGDGITDSSGTTVNHAYSSAGTYTVTLTVQTSINCIAIYSSEINVISSPIANFNFANICDGISAQFTDLSSSSSLTFINNWNWTFGDNTTSTIQNPSNLYPDSGSYSVMLKVTDNNGCMDSISQMIIIYPTSEVHFSFSKACTNNDILFSDSSLVIGSSINSWTWNFGDGSTLNNLQHPTHSYTLSSAYTVQLTVQTAQGCIDSLTKLIVVESSPQFQLLMSKACQGNPNHFDFTYIGNPVLNPGFNWNFGDSSSSLQAQPSHTYLSSGLKNVTFTLTDLNNGCLKTDTLIAEVLPNPIANFQSDSTCSGASLHLIDLSTSGSDVISGWNWTSTLPLQANSQNQHITFTTAGVYSVKMIVITTFGCMDSIVKTAEIFPIPISNFTYTPSFGSPPLLVTFSNTSGPGSSIWDFGDGSTMSNQSSPIHSYLDTGIYVVTLTTTSPNGCVNSSSAEITVLLPYLDIAVESCSYSEINSNYEVESILRNVGNIPIQNFNINAYLQSRSPISEFIENLQLLPGQSMNLKFRTQFIKEGFTPDYLCVEITKVNQLSDAIRGNNESCTSMGNSGEIFNIYPNPGSGLYTIPINTSKEKDILISIHDLYGRTIEENHSYTLVKGFNRILLNLNNESAGTYVITFTDGEKTSYQKLIKK